MMSRRSRVSLTALVAVCLAAGCMTPADDDAGTNLPTGQIAVDNVYVYWEDIESLATLDRRLFRAPKDGGPAEQIAQDAIWDFELDQYEGVAYYLSTYQSRDQIFLLMSGLPQVIADDVGMDWVVSGGRVYSVSISGRMTHHESGTETPLAEFDCPGFVDCRYQELAVDAAFFYAIDEDRGLVQRIPIDGGGPSPLGQIAPGEIKGLRASDGSVYWIGGMDGGMTQVFAMAAGSATATPLGPVVPENERRVMAIGSGRVVWAVHTPTETGIGSVATDGTDYELIPLDDPVNGLVVYGDSIFATVDELGGSWIRVPLP